MSKVPSRELRAAPVRSWAIAVCVCHGVCVNRLIYRYITMTTVGLHPRHQGHNASGRSGKSPSQDYF